MDRTKKVVILFITTSLIFILGISTYRSFNGSYSQKNNETTTDYNNEEKTNDKNLKKEDNQDQIKKEENTKEYVSENDIKQKKSSTEASSSKQETSKKPQTEIDDKNKVETNTAPENKGSIVETETITIQIEVIGIKETMMSDYLKVEKDSNAYSVLKTLAGQKNIKVSTSGYGSMAYVKGIGDLYEKQYGSGSGWMYKVNDSSPNIGAGSYKLKDGDHVLWYYVYSE